jgi:UDP-N-acetylmuramoyl-tripeptide--D-alanyl-D-alanine ligase
MNHLGELDYLSNIANPDVALVNNIGPAHIGLLGSLDNIALAKSEIFSGLQEKGVAVINADDSYADFLRQKAKPHTIKTFALETPADVMGKVSDLSLKIQTSIGECEIPLPLLGKHNQLNALAATTMALTQNIPLNIIQKGLKNIPSIKGRLQEIRGFRGARLIDDTYNANPESAWASANVLASCSGKKIWVLGDMGELGEYGETLHRELGEKVATLTLDQIFTLGTLSHKTSQAIGDNAKHFTEKSELISTLRSLLDENTTVLIKGSRFMKMETILQGLLNGEEAPA